MASGSIHRDAVIPSVFYPTTVVMMDDDPEFLSSAATYMDEFPTVRFSSYQQALTYVRGHCSPVSLEYENVAVWLANRDRFKTVSVVLVDYQMDARNGIEFCRETATLPVRKIMISGQITDPAAIELLNDDLVERYVSKRDPDRWNTIGAYVRQLQQRFMRIEHPLAARHHNYRAVGVHSDTVFRDWLFEFCRSQHFVEFVRVPVGFLLVDALGAVSLMLVRDADEVRELARRAQDELKAPEGVVNDLASGRSLVHNPDDPWGDRLLGVGASTRHWRGMMHDGRAVMGMRGNYVVALIEDVRPYPDVAGYSYDEYLADLHQDYGSDWES